MLLPARVVWEIALPSSTPAGPLGNTFPPCTYFQILKIFLSCPYITSVGATKAINNSYEVVAYDPAGDPFPSAFASGGGFSNIFPIPDYQADAVARFAPLFAPKCLISPTNMFLATLPTTPLPTLPIMVVFSAKMAVSSTGLAADSPTSPLSVTTFPSGFRASLILRQVPLPPHRSLHLSSTVSLMSVSQLENLGLWDF